MVQIVLDRAPTQTPVRTFDADGRMRTVANISKAAVNPYKGVEVPDWEALGLDPDRTYQLWRSPRELARSAPSFRGLPLLLTHRPLEASDHERSLVVGCIGDVEWDPPYLVADIMVWDQHALDAIEGGQNELSAGYHYTPDMTPGIFEGRRFDGRMTQISGNHIALVDFGRVGASCAL
jgi:hypothetical protein